MSEATTRAYAAAAEALKLNVLAYGGTLLDLDVFKERLTESAEDPYGVDIVVEIRPGLEITFPLVTTSMKEWRRRGPGSPTEMLVRALGRLAMVRVWRSRGTIAPPAGLLEVNGLGKALIERTGVDPQAFFDAVWSPVRIGDKYTDTADWMSEGAVTPLLSRAPAATRKTRQLPEGLPWLSGYSNLNTVFVEAVALDERLAVLWRPQDASGFEVRLAPGMMPDTLLAAAPGRPFRQYVSHPLLDRLQLRIVSVRQHQKSLRLKLDGGSTLWRRVRLKGGNEERAELKQEIRMLRDGRRHLEKLIAGHLTLPGQRGDTEVPWDDILDEDEIDEFTGQPGPEVDHGFEGISGRRYHEERLHNDGDPPIRFDENDPASYA
ncbi:MAG: hypothetical protein KYX69_09010 [Sphingomonas sp.]|uniref:hypothetical protein n=1 Tax=Sphingomonas sp. TaxID=28214 RepID=UPI00262A63EA|nr:hypothetical protein [Sphingomonas sp.]MDK2767845.1 hypothetical protein [Sphingomonas sp.]